jgi:hypothetical protein
MYILVILPTYENFSMKLTASNVQWKTPDDGQGRFPKHTEFYNRINLDN